MSKDFILLSKFCVCFRKTAATFAFSSVKVDLLYITNVTFATFKRKLFSFLFFIKIIIVHINNE